MKPALDTATMVAAIRSDAGASRRLLVAALERRLTLLAPVPLMIEYQAVMSRPQQLEASGLSAEDVALNQLINVAVAEKLSALRTESTFAERAARADIPKARDTLERAGKGNPPAEGDELPT